MYANDVLLPVRTCIVTFWLLTTSAAAETGPSRNERLPAFRFQPLFRNASTYYLAAGEDWQPSGATQISVLMAQQPLAFHTALTGSEVGLNSIRLLYKCSSTDSEYREELLEAAVQSSTHCSPLRPFSLERVNESLYRLTLLRENQLPFGQALRHSLEFRLRLSFYMGQLESASLFVFNFDALSKIPAIPDSGGSGTTSLGINRYRGPCLPRCNEPFVDFTTTTSDVYLCFLSIYNVRWQSQEHTMRAHMPLLRQEFTDVIRQAEPMVRTLLSLTLYYSKNCSDFSQPPLVMVRSGGGNVISSNALKHSNGYFLDMNTGYMHMTLYAASGFFTERTITKHDLDVCLNISVNGSLWPYFLTYRVHKSIGMYYGDTYSLPPLITEDCALSAPATSSKIQLPANLYNVSLQCPVICSGVFRALIYFNGIHCRRAGSNSGVDRPPCSRFFSASPQSCQIDLLGPTSQMHAGNYTIVVGEIKYIYRVTVVSLPVFTPDSLSTDTRDFNPKSAPVTLSCTVTHSGIGQFGILPQFRLLERFKTGVRWSIVEPREFGVTVLDGDPEGVAQTSNHTETRSEVHVRLTSRKEEFWWVSWKAAFECSASATRSDAQLFGLPEYHVKASWNLVFTLDFDQFPLNLAAASHLSPLLHSFAALALLLPSALATAGCL